jgi:hypothetical protein
MSKLDTISQNPEAKRVLKGINFDFTGAHIAYTSEEQGGAASLLNDPILLKAKDSTVTLTEAQKEIISKLGEESTPLDKKLSEGVEVSSSSSSEVSNGEENINVNKENEVTMADDKLATEVAELRKELAVQKAVNSLTDYSFEKELTTSVAAALASLETADQEAVLKAFDALEARTEVEVTKAKEAAPEEVNELAKALGDEAGIEGEAEVEVVKTLAERIKEDQDAMKGGK